MRYGDAMDHLESRAKRLGMAFTDAAELELCVYFQLQRLVDTYDIDAFTVDDPVLAVTTSGIEAYALPDNFSRLVHPHDARNSLVESGFRLAASSTDVTDLSYQRPAAFMRLDRVSTGRPSAFTILGRDLYLNPVPDSNASAHYTVQGTYIRQVGIPDLDETIPLDEPSFLITSALFQVASDTPKTDPSVLKLLQTEYTQQLSAVVNNQARRRQAFYNSRFRPGRG